MTVPDMLTKGGGVGVGVYAGHCRDLHGLATSARPLLELVGDRERPGACGVFADEGTKALDGRVSSGTFSHHLRSGDRLRAPCSSPIGTHSTRVGVGVPPRVCVDVVGAGANDEHGVHERHGFRGEVSEIARSSEDVWAMFVIRLTSRIRFAVAGIVIVEVMTRPASGSSPAWRCCPSPASSKARSTTSSGSASSL